MKTNKFFILVLVLFFSLSLNQSFCQTSDSLVIGKPVQIDLVNGQTVNGYIEKMGEKTIEIRNDLGVVVIERANILALSFTESKKDLLEKRYRNNMDQYGLFPSALPVGEGNNYYKNINIFFSQFNFGFTDYFSLGVGFEKISLLFDNSFPVMFITPKFSFGEGSVHGSVSTTIATSPGIGEVVGIATGSLTFGSERDNYSFTLGTSFAYTSEEASEIFLNIGTLLPMSEKISFVGEALFAPEFDEAIYSIGIRNKTKTGLTWDFGIIRPTDDIDGIGIPQVSVAVPLN